MATLRTLTHIAAFATWRCVASYLSAVNHPQQDDGGNFGKAFNLKDASYSVFGGSTSRVLLPSCVSQSL